MTARSSSIPESPESAITAQDSVSRSILFRHRRVGSGRPAGEPAGCARDGRAAVVPALHMPRQGGPERWP
jgi:hypothetical protein